MHLLHLSKTGKNKKKATVSSKGKMISYSKAYTIGHISFWPRLLQNFSYSVYIHLFSTFNTPILPII